tara:strand:+ start:293 stop:541 length:249 start_codon:yes stop_codon:yes gene_type:complete
MRNSPLKGMITKFSTQGYNVGSPDVGKSSNLIDSTDITMKNVQFPVTGIGADGQVIHMQPGVSHYKFRKGPVLEIPTKKIKK